MRVALALLSLLALPVAAQEEPYEDPRSRVLLEQRCQNQFSKRILTLFANGTLRQLDGEGATRVMRLAEVGPEELDAFLARLGLIRFDDLAPSSQGMGGEWVENCRLELNLPDREKHSFDYGPLDSMPLGLRHVLLVVDDLLLELERVRPGAPRARGFKVELGDLVVRRRDGARFEVLGFTVEGNGVELQGIDQPITIYVLKEHVQLEFDPDEDGGQR